MLFYMVYIIFLYIVIILKVFSLTEA